jgi:hypothetical protein
MRRSWALHPVSRPTASGPNIEGKVPRIELSPPTLQQSEDVQDSGSNTQSRRIWGHAVTVVALATLAMALILDLKAPVEMHTIPSTPPAQSQPIPLARPMLVIPAVSPPTATGPCADSGGMFPYGGPTCVNAGAKIGVAYPVLWYDHCGLWPWTEFNGTRFYVAALDPSAVDEGLGCGFSNFIPGTMTLASPHRAVFHDDVTGRTVEFVDNLPGQVGKAYRFHIEIYPSWRILESTFAGRLWISGAIPAGLTPPAYGGSGPPPAKIVLGTFTLVSDTQALFVADSGDRLQFTISYPMCA